MVDSCWKATVVLLVTGCVREIKQQGPLHKEIFAVVVGVTNGICIVLGVRNHHHCLFYHLNIIMQMALHSSTHIADCLFHVLAIKYTSILI